MPRQCTDANMLTARLCAAVLLLDFVLGIAMSSTNENDSYSDLPNLLAFYTSLFVYT